MYVVDEKYLFTGDAFKTTGDRILLHTFFMRANIKYFFSSFPISMASSSPANRPHFLYKPRFEVMNKEHPENIDYYVYYEAKVKAGIDFDKVEVGIDHEGKKILITIPELPLYILQHYDNSNPSLPVHRLISFPIPAAPWILSAVFPFCRKSAGDDNNAAGKGAGV